MLVNKLIITRLFQSFVELERAIRSARVALEKKGNPPRELVDRIESYEEMLDKQRTLANDIVGFVDRGEWQHVDRNVKLINAMSQMIRDDAREIVMGMRPTLSLEEREMMLS
jgi:hypothetical protein